MRPSRLRAAVSRWLTALSTIGLVRPLEQHIVICGFPRSGSTLMQAWLEAAIPGIVAYGRERKALIYARRFVPGVARVLLTKRPDDVHALDAIRAHYAGSPTALRIILTVRDPRAVLVSRHGASREYYVSPERWRRTAVAVERHWNDPDVLIVAYEAMVTRPAEVADQIAAFLGATLDIGLDAAHAAVPAGFDTSALNGVRPLDTSRLRSWECPEHAARLRDVMTPDVQTYLTRWGYEL